MSRIASFVLWYCLYSFLAVSSLWAASPCDGVDRRLTNERKATLAPAIAKELKVKRVDVLQSFRQDGWSIIYVDTHESDETFVFYAHDPMKNHYVTLWGGVALPEEERQIKRWVLKNAPGIPAPLAACFAWHVSKER